MSDPCPAWKTCRAMLLTTEEFMRLGGESWSQSFKVRVGIQAAKLHREVFEQPIQKQRKRRNWHNKVGVYPCGIMEQAYRIVKEREEAEAAPVP